MISVESRDDGRKGLEKGFCINNKRDMDDETELEEGEACSYHNDDDDDNDDTSIDPDVALSYIDEKLQNVLGHFKKDFEGVVSAENLGAKYGIYGSFLPAYRRSPVCSHSRSPPRVQNHNTQSPIALRVEGGHHNSLAQANAPHPMKHGAASVGSSSPYPYKPPSQNDLHRQTARTQLMQSVEECTPKSEVRDQRTLKVRIKVGSDNLAVKKNAAIYSGLGLECSPSSSLDDSPLESEGLSHGPAIDTHDYPDQLLKIMTSSPLFGGHLLSPLPDYLIQLSERIKPLQAMTQPSSKAKLENSVMECLPFHSVKDNQSFYEENRMKLLDKKGLSLQVKRDSYDDQFGFEFSLKESDSDALSCEELVSNALKLPLLSNAYSITGASAKVSLNEKVYSDSAKGEPLEAISAPVSLSDKPNRKGDTDGNIEDKGAADTTDDIVSDIGKIGENKGETANSSTSTDSVGMKLKRASKSGRKDPLKQRNTKSACFEGGMGLHCGKEKLTSADKKKPKRSQAHGFAPPRKVVMETAKDGSQVVQGSRFTDRKTLGCRELENSAMKDLSNDGEKYKEFFGDMNEEECDIMDSLGVPFTDRVNTCEVVEKTTLTCDNTLRERPTTLESCKGAISRTHVKRSYYNASVSENGLPTSDPASGPSDDWVCCDKCLTWRLLPPGSKVEDLPEKWLCSMQTWLPDMNCCSISEDETTNALRARYQLHVENPNGHHLPLDRATDVTSAVILEPLVPKDGKMIDKLRKTSKSSFQDSPNQLPSSTKKKQQSAKDRTPAEVQDSSLMNNADFQRVTKSRINKHGADCDSDGGRVKITKIKSKREPDEEFIKMCKKSKRQNVKSGDSDRVTAHDQGNEILRVSSGYNLAYNTVGKDQTANSEFFSSRKSKHEIDDGSRDTFGKSNQEVETFTAVGSLHVSKSGCGKIAPKKRKVEKFLDPPNSTPLSGKLISDSEQFQKKRHRVSKSEGKESNGSKRNGKADKRGRSISQHRLDNTESFEKDSSCAQPVVAAASSSSKVSGSLKTKSNFQELKGSPVESVSSSPLRISNSDKLTLGRKGRVEKDIIQDDVKLATGGPRMYSDGGDEDGSDQTGSKRLNITETGPNPGFVEPCNAGFQHRDDLAHISPKKLHRGLSAHGSVSSLDPVNGHPSEAQTSDRFVDGATGGECHHNTNLSCSVKSLKDPFSLCTDKNQMFKSNSNKGKIKMYESHDSPQDHTPACQGKEDSSIKAQEKFGSDAGKVEEDAICNKQEASFSKSKEQWDYDEKRSLKKFDMENSEQLSSISMREKSLRLSSSDGEKTSASNSVRPYQGNGMSTSSCDARASDLPKEPKSNKKGDSQDNIHQIPSKHPISNGHKVRNQDAPSPLRRDPSSQAAGNALKEATELKHLADRLKQNAGSADSTGLYFEAALKFLHGASLLESGKAENAKHGNMVQSRQIYIDTAKLCGFCAHEYEKSKDMATAALAYKCMEVAYMRVIYSSHHSASRDRHELQTVLQMVPPGESPSSSASDIDNLNNITNGDKAAQVRIGGSPQLAANLVIGARNRPNFLRLLSFAQDVNSAMEASRKSRNAFAAATISISQGDSKEGISSIKRALDFNFHDVQGLLRLVRLAKEVTSR